MPVAHWKNGVPAAHRKNGMPVLNLRVANGMFSTGPPGFDQMRPRGAFRGTRVLAGQLSCRKTGPWCGLRAGAPGFPVMRPLGGSGLRASDLRGRSVRAHDS